MENIKQHNTLIVGLLSIMMSIATLGCSNLHKPLGMNGGERDADIDFSQLSPKEQKIAENARDQINHYREQVKSAQEKNWEIQQALPEQEKKDAQQLYALKRQLINNMTQLGVPIEEAEAATTLSPSGDDAETLKGSVQGAIDVIKVGGSCFKALGGSAEALKGSVQGASGVIKAVELNPPGGSITSM